jgi:hypothetical protein
MVSLGWDTLGNRVYERRSVDGESPGESPVGGVTRFVTGVPVLLPVLPAPATHHTHRLDGAPRETEEELGRQDQVRLGALVEELRLEGGRHLLEVDLARESHGALVAVARADRHGQLGHGELRAEAEAEVAPGEPERGVADAGGEADLLVID